MGLKRIIYGMPAMRAYRDHRTRVLATQQREHFAGFRFAGTPAFFDPQWELDERTIIEEQLDAADVFVDIGANQGLYTCLAAHRGKKVVAVEPEPGNLRFLLSNAAANGFVPEVFAMALAREPGIAEIFGDGDTASLVPGWASARSNFAQRIAVNTLDNLLAERWRDRSIFIKMDVEGVEFSVLQGAQRMLDRDRKPSWLIETFPVAFDGVQTRNDNFVPLFELMGHNGYVCMQAQTRQSVSLEQVRKWAQCGASADVGRSNYLFRPL